MKYKQKCHVPLLHRGFNGLLCILPLLCSLPGVFDKRHPNRVIPAWRDEDTEKRCSKRLTMDRKREQKGTSTGLSDLLLLQCN